MDTDLNLASTTYLGGAGADAGNAVVIQSGGDVVVGGVFSALPAAGTDRTLLGAAASAPGSVLHFNSDGTVLQSITRLGAAVDDLDLDPRNDRLAVAGDFGLAMLSPDGASVIWSQSGSGIGASGAAVYSAGRRVAVGSDGTVAAIFDGFSPGSMPVTGNCRWSSSSTVPPGSTRREASGSRPSPPMPAA